MQLGEKIYTLRSRAGYSQENFAEALGVSRQSVSRWENDTAVPDTEYLVKMSRLLSVSLDELLLAEELPPIEERAPMSEEEAQERASLKTFTLVGFILSFCVCAAGLVMSILAAIRWKKMGEESAQAVAGIAVSACILLFAVLALAVSLSLFAATKGGAL